MHWPLERYLKGCQSRARKPSPVVPVIKPRSSSVAFRGGATASLQKMRPPTVPYSMDVTAVCGGVFCASMAYRVHKPMETPPNRNPAPFSHTPIKSFIQFHHSEYALLPFCSFPLKWAMPRQETNMFRDPPADLHQRRRRIAFSRPRAPRSGSPSIVPPAAILSGGRRDIDAPGSPWIKSSSFASEADGDYTLDTASPSIPQR